MVGLFGAPRGIARCFTNVRCCLADKQVRDLAPQLAGQPLQDIGVRTLLSAGIFRYITLAYAGSLGEIAKLDAAFLGQFSYA